MGIWRDESSQSLTILSDVFDISRAQNVLERIATENSRVAIQNCRVGRTSVWMFHAPSSDPILALVEVVANSGREGQPGGDVRESFEMARFVSRCLELAVSWLGQISWRIL